jgi:hypothetical protein
MGKRDGSRICLLFAACVIPTALLAHDPLDCSTQVMMREDRIEVAVTMGLDGVREILSEAGFSAQAIRETVAARGPQSSRELPAALASRLFEVKRDGEPLAPGGVTGNSDGMEVVFRVDYPRPPEGVLELDSVYFDAVEQMRPGWLAAHDEDGNRLLAVMLSVTNRIARLPLPRKTTTEQPVAPRRATVSGSSDEAKTVPRSGDVLPATGTSTRLLEWQGLCGIVIVGVWLAFRMRRTRTGAKSF